MKMGITNKMSSIVAELKNFAFKGNVVDLAVGVIIGSAFGKIIDSLVKHLIMPVISVLLPGQQSYLAWKWTINNKDIPYGLFIGEIVNFLIIALALYFFIVKFLGWVMRAKKEETSAVALAATKDQEMLTEFRDFLKKSRCTHTTQQIPLPAGRRTSTIYIGKHFQL